MPRQRNSKRGEPLNDENDWGPFEWLDRETIERISSYAVDATNKCVQEYVSQNISAWAVTPALNKATFIRAVLVGHVFDACGAYEEITTRTEKNINFLELPGGRMLLISKTIDPALAPEESKTLREARMEGEYELSGSGSFGSENPQYTQLILSLPESVETETKEEDPPTALSRLRPFFAAYQCEGDLITSVYIQDIDRDRETVRAFVKLDLSRATVPIASVETSEELVRPSFSLKAQDVEVDERKSTV
jgi:hypothetical protein